MDKNTCFHRAIVDLSGHDRLVELVDQLHIQTFRIQSRQILATSSPHLRDASVVEHQEVADAILGGDAAGAEELMRHQLRHMRDDVKQLPNHDFGRRCRAMVEPDCHQPARKNLGSDLRTIVGVRLNGHRRKALGDTGREPAVDLGLKNAVAVVTGGSKGMGLAIAESLGAEGASVAIMARGQRAMESAAARVRDAGAPEVLTIEADMSAANSISAAFATVDRAWGRLNVLIHTIGPGAGAFEDVDDVAWHEAFDLGTMSAVRSVREALPMLRAADWARIVTLSAHSIQRQSPRLVAYTATKAALSSLTKNLSKSLGPEGILVNCVCPGTIVTASFTELLKETLAADGLDSADPNDVMRWVEQTYGHPCDVGRAGLPEEIASVTTYLASRRNGYVTGATVNVDGGSDFV